MKIIKFKKGRTNKYTVYFDDDTNVKLYDDVIIKYNLLSHKELDYDEFEEIINYNDKLGSYYKALRYITNKLRTEKEVFEYLSKEYTRKTSQETIDKLKQEGYFNKEVYLKCYMNDAINLNNIGPLKIKDNLKKLGFNEDEFMSYINDIDDDIWLEKVNKQVSKRVKTNHTYGTYKLKEKILYDVTNMGYPKWMVEEYLKDIEVENSDSILEKEYNKQYNKLIKKYEGYELFTQIKLKLISKGFSYNEVDEFIQNKKNT